MPVAAFKKELPGLLYLQVVVYTPADMRRERNRTVVFVFRLLHKELFPVQVHILDQQRSSFADTQAGIINDPQQQSVAQKPGSLQQPLDLFCGKYHR